MITIEPQTKRVRIIFYKEMPDSVKGWKIGLPEGVLVKGMTDIQAPNSAHHTEEEGAIIIAIVGEGVVGPIE